MCSLSQLPRFLLFFLLYNTINIFSFLSRTRRFVRSLTWLSMHFHWQSLLRKFIKFLQIGMVQLDPGGGGAADVWARTKERGGGEAGPSSEVSLQ